MHIAFITPWPPQPTGIADYAFDLISDLSIHDLIIHVFSDCENPLQVNGVEFFNLNTSDLFQLNDYDLRIYQMGNNVHFHLYMLNLIKEYPGIVHLHDMVLHHLMGWITWMQDDVSTYFGLISKWYGERISCLCYEMMKQETMPWDSEVVADIPFFEEFIQYADACIVNSNFSKNRLKAAFPELDVYRVTQLYKGMHIKEKNCKDGKQISKIGVFGGIEPNKQVNIILESFSVVNDYNSNWHLHIVGEVSDQCKHIPELKEKFGIADNVTFYGRLDDENFKRRLSEMDLIIALRSPTMGETSAVAARAMQMGIPLIVTDVGWYAELPAFIDKVPAATMIENLTKLLLKYITEKDYHAKKKQEFVKYSRKHLNPDKIVKDFLKILAIEYLKKSNCKPIEIISDLFYDLGFTDDVFMRNTVKKLKMVF